MFSLAISRPITRRPYKLLPQRWRAASHIFYVPSNHEFYHGEIKAVGTALAERCRELGIELLDSPV